MRIGSDGLELEEVVPATGSHVYDYWVLMPDASWFWEGLALHCDPGCCGLDAYDFSHKAVRWICGDNVKLTGRKKRLAKDRPRRQSDALQLAVVLRDLATEIRSLDEPCVMSSYVFSIAATPESHADLFAQLADWLERPLPT